MFAQKSPGDQRTAISVALIVLMLASLAAGQILTGAVNDSTGGKPSAGDEVIVFSLGQDFKESGRTNTDATGHFNLKLDNAKARYLVRIIHQGVAYHRFVPVGATSIAVDVYDIAQKVNGIGVVADIMRIQAGGGKITVTRDFGVRNASSPPRVQLNERNLEFYIPDGAHIVENSGTAIVENGPPMKSVPIAESEKNRYAFVSPVRPGFMRFEVSYELPYSGSARFDPKSIYPLENFMVMLPKSMQFKAISSTGFKSVKFPNGPDAAVLVALNTKERQNLAFKISGEGALPPAGRQHGVQSSMPPKESSASLAPAAHSNDRSGGGSPLRVDTLDVLQVYRWWILSGLAAIVVIAGVGVGWRQQAASRALMRRKDASSNATVGRVDAGYDLTDKNVLEAARWTTPAVSSEPMRQIKERLFNIEIERKKGKISQAEFENARTALDRMLDSALKREAQNA